MTLSPPLSAKDVGKRFMTADGRVAFLIFDQDVIHPDGRRSSEFTGVVTSFVLGSKIEFVSWCESGEVKQGRTRKLNITHRIDGWNDIESAPKDGLKILGFLEARVVECISNGDGCYADPENVGTQFVSILVPVDPTHWMPLPDPPGDAP